MKTFSTFLDGACIFSFYAFVTNIFIALSKYWFVSEIGAMEDKKSDTTEYVSLGFPGGSVDKESACNVSDAGRHKFDPWVGKILWRRTWQPAPVFLAWKIPWTEEPGRLQSMGS